MEANIAPGSCLLLVETIPLPRNPVLPLGLRWPRQRKRRTYIHLPLNVDHWVSGLILSPKTPQLSLCVEAIIIIFCVRSCIPEFSCISLQHIYGNIHFLHYSLPSTYIIHWLLHFLHYSLSSAPTPQCWMSHWNRMVIVLALLIVKLSGYQGSDCIDGFHSVHVWLSMTNNVFLFCTLRSLYIIVQAF